MPIAGRNTLAVLKNLPLMFDNAFIMDTAYRGVSPHKHNHPNISWWGVPFISFLTQ